jgi:hypothetical protein
MSSVLLNFNKNLDNGDAYKFSQFYDDKVQIPENATISLNNAQLTRKAIVVEEDSSITINLTNPNNDNDLARTFDPARNLAVQYNVADINYTFPKGDYSKREFLNTLYDKTNEALLSYNSDPLRSTIPYSACVANTNDKGVFGLALDYVKLDYERNTNFRMENNTQFDSSNVAIFPASVGSVSATEFNTFTFAQSGINTLNFDKDNVSQSALTFGLFDKDTTGNSREYFLVFNNQKTAANWSVATEMDKETLEDGTEVPKGYIGVHWINDATAPTGAVINIYQSDNLADFNNELFELNPTQQMGNMVLVSTLKMEEVIDNQRYAFQFYQENDFNASDVNKIKNYYRLLAVNIDDANNSILQPNDNVIFDSKTFGKTISNDLMTRGFKMDDNVNPGFPDSVFPSGMVPVFGFRSISGSAEFDQGFYDIEGPFINLSFNTVAEDSLNNFGIGYYSITVSEELANIFGSDILKRINPNGMTDAKLQTADFCVSQFYQDNLAYNIQVDNLPINTYQSVSKGNTGTVNIGTKKPVVLKLNSLFEGKVDNLNSSRLVRTHYENFNKNLKLRNKYSIDTNNFDVSVRRARSNELATEITDCSIELVFDKE